MKKLVNKILRRNTQKPPETGGRITNETVAAHRERVLAGGRKFKYPLQYTKRRVLVISTIIVVLSTISFVLFCWWQLYNVQNTSKFFYSLTQLAPVPVAKVDGEWVKYSDYLRELRSSIHYLTTKEAINFNSEDGKRQLEYQKRLALNRATEATLVAKLGKEKNIQITQQEVDNFVRQQITSNRLGVNEDVYRQVIRDYYDWSLEEYKDSVRKQLLRKKVMAQLDTENRAKITGMLEKVQGGADFAAVAKDQSEDVNTKAQGGDVGVVDKADDDPSGLIAAALKLEPNQTSGVIEGVDGFYIVKLLEKRDHDLRFAKLFVSYKILAKKMIELRDTGRIEEFIQVQEVRNN